MADGLKQHTLPDLLWAGTQHSLAIAIEAHSQIMAGPFNSTNDDEDEDAPYNFSIQGEVGVITIRGSLTNSDSPYNRYYGMTGYPDIRKALVYAAERSDVKAILLDISSGGGAVNGVSDTGDLISMVDEQVKPVYAVTDGTMASAAYWLGSSARKVYASKTSVVGSIGVIMTHMEYSKALKEAGVGVNVIRAGEFKALLNSYEPATKAALEQAGKQLAVAYDIFVGHVADARGVTVSYADQHMAQGREFMGQEALDANLVDGIASFDAVLSMISASVLDKPGVTQSQYGQHTGRTMKTALTAQQIAAIQAGAPQAAVTGQTAETIVPAPAAEVTPAPAAAVTTEPAAAEPAPAAAASAAASTDAVVSLLQGQLATAQTASVNLQVQLQVTQNELTAIKAAQASLQAIAADSLNTMRIALGMQTSDLSGMTADALIREHGAAKDQFNSKFKAGGVAAASAAVEPVATPLTAARKAALASTKF